MNAIRMMKNQTWNEVERVIRAIFAVMLKYSDRTHLLQKLCFSGENKEDNELKDLWIKAGLHLKSRIAQIKSS